MASTAGDSRRNKRLRQQEVEDLANQKNLIEALMSDPRSRRWLWLQIGQAGVFTSIWPLDQLELAYREGRRAGGLALLDQIMRWTPKLYTDMMSENSETMRRREEENERHDDSASGGPGDDTDAGTL